MVKDVLVFVVFWTVGTIVASLVFSQVLLSIFFAIPFTRKLASLSIHLNPNYSLRVFWIKALVFGTLTFAITGAIYSKVSRAGLLGYIIGFIVLLIVGRKKFGNNAGNVMDYIKMQGKYLDLDLMDELIDDDNTP